MKSKINKHSNLNVNHTDASISFENSTLLEPKLMLSPPLIEKQPKIDLAEILVITTYPPRECGVATYSQDLVNSLTNQFSSSLTLKICALESTNSRRVYPKEVSEILNTTSSSDYKLLSNKINKNSQLEIVLLQHEFGLFTGQETLLLEFLYEITKPIITVFHSVLPNPNEILRKQVRNIVGACESIIVMTHHSSAILTHDYDIPAHKISVIAHGTHLVPHLNKYYLKTKYNLKERQVLTTFGLLSAGKGIETSLEALLTIVEKHPEVVFLIIGKTHPAVQKVEGEKYRSYLETMVWNMQLEKHVIFINQYLALSELLEYLQLSDIYLFTSNDPNQAVSGTFAYAMSCACPIISTPIPHATEYLTPDTGVIIEFNNPKQLADAVISLLNDDELRRNISDHALQKITPTAWENSAIAHASLFEKISNNKFVLKYNIPPLNLDHFRRMTTKTGMVQFSKINEPDLKSGYTLDDNSTALIAAADYFRLYSDKTIIPELYKYLHFIELCVQPNGSTLNYVNRHKRFTSLNFETNLDDSKGRAIWALGYIISLVGELPSEMVYLAKKLFDKILPNIMDVHSTRSMAFAVKGLCYYYQITKSSKPLDAIILFSNRLVEIFKVNSNEKWQWFEEHFANANSFLSEALLLAWKETGTETYKTIGMKSFDFLLSRTFYENKYEETTENNWLIGEKGGKRPSEQPIDVAFTIMTLSSFFEVFRTEDYLIKMRSAFNWFLGYNRLSQIVYNPCTGGCYDGLNKTNVNLNQGAESTISYLIARLTIEHHNRINHTIQSH